jgi:hypothetical protein
MRMRCSVHQGPIRGRVHFWNHQAMCSKCYARFTKNVRVIRPWPEKTRSMQQRQGLWARLRRLLAG